MEIRIVGPDYLQTIGTPLRKGRGFTALDTDRTRPVVLINEALARQWWPQEDPIGDRIEVGSFRGRPVMAEATREVAGIVADAKTLYLTEAARPTLFIPIAQAGWYGGGMNWVMRADAPEALAAREQIIASATANPRFDATIFGGFVLFSVLLAALGVYGLLAFSVARRTGEIGTRMALGASPGQVCARDCS